MTCSGSRCSRTSRLWICRAWWDGGGPPTACNPPGCVVAEVYHDHRQDFEADTMSRVDQAPLASPGEADPLARETSTEVTASTLRSGRK